LSAAFIGICENHGNNIKTSVNDYITFTVTV